jgi:hypothetical protein
MTREEAIARIKDHKIVHKMNEPRAIYISEALDMAIKALEQEPCNDCVSRQDALNCFKIDNTKGDVWYALKELPPVTPKQRTGHWITTRTFMHDGEFYCDKCNCDAPNNEKWDYCPNCGVKMVEPQESEETK